MATMLPCLPRIIRSARCCREVLMVVREWPEWGAAVAATVMSEPVATMSAPATIFSKLGAVFREPKTAFRKTVVGDGWL